MREQTFNKIKRTAFILLAVFLVISLTTASASAWYSKTSGGKCKEVAKEVAKPVQEVVKPVQEVVKPVQEVVKPVQEVVKVKTVFAIVPNCCNTCWFGGCWGNFWGNCWNNCWNNCWDCCC